MNITSVFPPFDIHLSDLNQFILDLVEEYRAEKIRSWDDLEKRVKAFFTAKQIEHVESVVPGWRKMASFLDGVTLVHVIGVFLGLMVLPEFQYLSERQQEIAKWIVLFHDVEKEIRKGERDPKHAFRSAVTAARRLPHLGFAVTKEYDSLITSWSEFTSSAIKKPSDLPEPVQDNDKLPEILAGIEKMFGNDTPAALIVKGVLLHMSINVVEDWPQASPMTQAEIKRNVKRNLVPFLKVMMLADNEGWVMFYSDRVKQRNETLEAFERIEQIMSGSVSANHTDTIAL